MTIRAGASRRISREKCGVQIEKAKNHVADQGIQPNERPGKRVMR